MASIQQFEQLLQQMLSPDNAERNRGEAFFETLKQNPESLISSLVQLLRQSAAPEVCDAVGGGGWRCDVRSVGRGVVSLCVWCCDGMLLELGSVARD